MSSTTGIQNLLVNVFRPVYRYETPPGDSNTIFIPKLAMSNIDTYSGNVIAVQTASVGDSNNNVYVGSNAGNPYTTVKACRFVSAFGYNAGSNISNVSNSVFIGYNAGQNASGVTSNVIIGTDAQGIGSSNIRIGSLNVGAGNSNISIGTNSSTSSYSNCIVLGNNVTATSDNEFRVGSSFLWGNLNTKWLGVNTPSILYDSNSKFDVSGNATVKGQVGINMAPTRTLDVNGDFQASDAHGKVDFHLGDFTASNTSTGSKFTLSNDGFLYLESGVIRTLASASVVQPVIQYGSNTSGSTASGSVPIILPTAYTSTNYVIQVTMGDSTPAQVSAVVATSNSFTIYWSGASSLGHTIYWTTYGL